MSKHVETVNVPLDTADDYVYVFRSDGEMFMTVTIRFDETRPDVQCTVSTCPLDGSAGKDFDFEVNVV